MTCKQSSCAHRMHKRSFSFYQGSEEAEAITAPWPQPWMQQRIRWHLCWYVQRVWICLRWDPCLFFTGTCRCPTLR